MTRYLCVCSGISAPTAAWKPRGWTPIAYAEIDPFASAVLAYHYGAGRPRYMPAPEEVADPKEASRRRNAIRALDAIEWGSAIVNAGDFTQLRHDPELIALALEADVLVGGTPCQAFSLAGLRLSLADDRGNLSLEFILLADAIDDLRRAHGKPPLVILWENVPGVLSVKDNAFGAFLGGLVESGSALLPPGRGGWTDAGVVAGPRRVAAWRTLDAQHFGLPQRRRRVFVLARGGVGALRVADALLPVIDSMRGHLAPSRGAGAEAPGDAGGGAPGRSRRRGEPLGRSARGPGGGGGDRAGRSVRRVAFGGNRTGGPIEVAPALLAKEGSGIRQDFESDPFVVEVEPLPFDPTQITHPENRSRPEPGDPAPTLARTGHPPAIAFNARQDPISGEVAGPLDTDGFSQGVAYAPEVAGPILSTTHQAGARTTELESGALIAQTPVPDREVATAMTAAGGTARKHGQGWGQGEWEGGYVVPVETQAFSMRGRDGENVIEPEADDVAPSMTAGAGGSNKPFVAYAFQERRRPDERGQPTPTAEWIEDQSYALTAPTGGGRAQERLIATAEEVKAFTVSAQANGFAWETDVNPAILAHPQTDKSNLQYGVRIGTAVRRLTPRECERLQGFPDDFTLIPYSNANRDEADLAQTVAYLLDAGYSDNEAKALASTPDGPRYRALGNSQAVDVIAELGERIEWLLAEGGW